VLAVVLALMAVVVGAAGGAVPASATPSTTRLVIHVHHCRTCTLHLTRAISGTSQYWRSHGKRVGADHVVAFRVPTDRTRGLSFELEVPWQDFTDARLNVVTRYAGHAVGDRVTARQAKHAKRAFGCWAGTDRARARLDLRVAPFTFKGGTDGAHESTGAVAWASPGTKSLKPRVRTWHGSIGNQEIFYCS
jgi:hypothetical protein